MGIEKNSNFKILADFTQYGIKWNLEARVLESGSIPTEEEHGFIFDLSTGFAYRKSSGETLWVRFHK